MSAPINVKLEEPSSYLRRMHVTVPAGEVDQAFQRTLATLKEKVSIPGFRRGKIPTQVIMQRFRKNIEADVLSMLLEHRLESLLESHSLNPVSQPRLEPGELAPGKDFLFVLEFEVLPEIQLEGLEELEVSVPPVELRDDGVDARLEQMRQADAQFRKAEGREGVLQGDMLIVDMVSTVEGQEPKEQPGQEIHLRGNLMPEVEEALLRARIGQPIPVAVDMPANHANREMAGKRVLLEMTVREIRERILPEMDDEWARDHDKESLEELRAEVADELRKEKERQWEQLVNQRILDKIIETRPFEIPPGLARAETEKRIAGMARLMGQIGQTLEGEDLVELHRTTRDRTYQDIRRSVVLESVVRQQGIEVSDEALEEKIAALAQQGPEPPAKVRARYSGKEAREGLKSELREEQAFAFLRSRVKIAEQADQQGEEPQ